MKGKMELHKFLLYSCYQQHGIALNDPSQHLIPITDHFSSVSAFTQRCQSAIASEETCEEDSYPHFSHWKAKTVFELPKAQKIHWMNRPKSKQLLSRAVSCAFKTAAIPALSCIVCLIDFIQRFNKHSSFRHFFKCPCFNK